MLARMQQLIAVAIVLAAATWIGAALYLGSPLWAVIGLLTAVTAHAFVLGLEFVLMANVNRRHREHPASPREYLAAWWAESIAAPRVFLWRQPFFSHRWPDRLPATPSKQARGVLLVHGFVCNRGLWLDWLERLSHLEVPFVAVNLEPVFGGIDDYCGEIEQAMQRLEQATQQPPVIVAHSMGGLAVRKWSSLSGNATRVAHLITLGTPHHGTWLARFAIVRNTRQMQQQSAWRAALEATESLELRRRTTCFYSHCDNIVFPASTGTLPGAHNRHLTGVAHVDMVDQVEPFEELIRRLRAPE